MALRQVLVVALRDLSVGFSGEWCIQKRGDKEEIRMALAE